jgi:hypothetical protein
LNRRWRMPEQQEQVPRPLYFDNTRVSAFFKCPRMYYYRHMRGWAREGNRIALAFGGAWHVMMEIVWTKANEDISDVVLTDLADAAFREKWREEGFGPDAINLDDKRNPGLARDLCLAYLEKYRAWLKKVTVLCNEQPFAIPLGQTADGTPIFYIGRWDKVWLDPNKSVYVGEHKTTSLYRKSGRTAPFAVEFLQSFSPDSQVDGYQFGALAAFGKMFRGVIVDACMVHKTVRGFTRIPVQRALANLESWAFDVTYWINELYDNAAMLAEVDKGDAYLRCFPKRTEQCFHKYGSCAFLQLCKYGSPNPEEMTELPEGFIYSPWDPFEHNVEEGQAPLGVGDGEKMVMELLGKE